MARSSDFAIRVQLPYAQQAETRAAAARYLERSGNADVAAALGLAEDVPEPEVAAPRRLRPHCLRCRMRLRNAWNGVCQRPTCNPAGGAR